MSGRTHSRQTGSQQPCSIAPTFEATRDLFSSRSPLRHFFFLIGRHDRDAAVLSVQIPTKELINSKWGRRGNFTPETRHDFRQGAGDDANEART